MDIFYFCFSASRVTSPPIGLARESVKMVTAFERINRKKAVLGLLRSILIPMIHHRFLERNRLPQVAKGTKLLGNFVWRTLAIAILWGFFGVIHSTAAPHLIPIGSDSITNECHENFIDPGVRISDAPISLGAGVAHGVALKADGSVVAWGLNNFGQTNVPAGLGPVKAIAANAWFSVALRTDGSVAAWGDGSYGQTNVPAAAMHDVAAIAAGGFHGLALRTDGSLLGWGDDSTGEIDIPSGATNVIAIAAGGQHSLALRRNGSVIAWGSDLYGQNEVPPSVTNIVAISDSGIHCLALRADGSVVTWGYDDQFHLLRVPASVTNVVAIVAKDSFSAAVRADGSVM